MMGRSKVIYSQTKNALMTVTESTIRYKIPITTEKECVSQFLKCERKDQEIIVHFTKYAAPVEKVPDIERDAKGLFPVIFD